MSQHPSSEPKATLPLFRRGAWYESLDGASLTGLPALQLSLAPAAMVRGDARRFRSAAAKLAPLGDRAARIDLFRRAIELFIDGTLTIGNLGPQDPQAFREAMGAVVGLPPALVTRWSHMLMDHLDRLPTEAADDALALIALPGNSFTCLEGVMDAAVRSGAIWIRPSRREPFSAARFAAALLAAGWPAPRLGFYPTTTPVLETLVDATDRQIVYGGDSIAAAFADRAALDLRGPGRACARVPKDADPQATAAWLAPLIASDSGRFCKSVCTVLCDGDAGALARELGAALDAIRLDPPDAELPIGSFPDPAQAHQIETFINGEIKADDRLVTERAIVQERDGRTYLAPTLVHVSQIEAHPLVGRELPFPFAAIVEVDPAEKRGVTDASQFIFDCNDN